MREKIKTQLEDPIFKEKMEKGRSAWAKAAWEEGGVLREKVKAGKAPGAKPVICLDTGEVFNSITAAAKAYSIDPSTVSVALHKENRTAGKDKNTKAPLHWAFLKDDSSSIRSTIKEEAS